MLLGRIRRWLYRPKRTDPQLLAQFYYADEELNQIAAELDNLDGRKDPQRCTLLVNQFRSCQDNVLNIINQIMEECIPHERANRDFCVKFPEEIRHDNLAGQLWFGAECLAAGSIIMNREIESMAMQPLAKALTRSLEEVRGLLRDQALRDLNLYTARMKEALKQFDALFAEFELSYVSAMVPVQSPKEYDAQQEVIVLFCETVERALKLGYLTQDMIDDYEPALMFTIPRLAIVCGLAVYPEGPLNLDRKEEDMSELFRPFHTLLRKIRDLLQTLTDKELYILECNLCISQDFDFPARGGSEVPSALIPNLMAALPSDALPERSENAEAELACSMQHDKQELEQLSQMVCRAGDEMSLLLSPPAPRSPPAGRPGPKRGSSGEPSPTGSLASEEHVFFIDDLEGARHACAGRGSARDACHGPCRAVPCGEPAVSEHQPCDLSGSRSAEESRRMSDASPPKSCTCSEGPESHLYFGTWDVYTHDAEAAEIIAQRTGGMKISATVIFNPRSSAGLEPSASAKVRDLCALAEEDPECRQLRVAGTNSLVNPCVCCGAHKNSGEENLRLKMNGFTGNTVNPSSSSLKLKEKGHRDQREHVLSVQEALNGEPYILLAERDPSEEALALPCACKCRAAAPGPERAAEDGSEMDEGITGQPKYERQLLTETSPLVAEETNGRIANEDKESRSSSSIGTASAGSLDLEETQLGSRAAQTASADLVRSRFHSSSDLIHRLFVCISGVADQLQTNYACDLRSILKTLFEAMATKPDVEDKKLQKKVNPHLSNLAPEDCALCQETVSSEPAEKAKNGNFEDPPEWVPDEACSFCTACNAPFTVIRRKHHCRSCGKIFCSRCSSHSAPLPRCGQMKPVRVCTHCYMFHVTPFYSDKWDI